MSLSVKYIRAAVTAVLIAIAAPLSFAQIVSEENIFTEATSDSIRKAMDNGPYFGLYKDNYFIFGTAVGSKPTKQNSNVKFQISFSQRLTKSVLPWNTYLFLFYTQKCFWNVLERSLPMTDLNFNPGIGLAKHLFVKNRYIGKLLLLAEHESNGRDGTASRSWNKISLGASIMIDPNFIVHGKVWLPIIDGLQNKDILNYCGIYQIGTSFSTINKRFGASVILTKRKGWELNYNTIVELNYKIFPRDNQYLFLQYYNGYGEGLLAFKEFHSQLRVGIVIKPQLFSDY
ncbi:MAG: phospholipase A [Bacteroidales bacterium]|nr:phospholipase A [Bacteroidales bacterium]